MNIPKDLALTIVSLGMAINVCIVLFVFELVGLYFMVKMVKQYICDELESYEWSERNKYYYKHLTKEDIKNISDAVIEKVNEGQNFDECIDSCIFHTVIDKLNSNNEKVLKLT